MGLPWHWLLEKTSNYLQVNLQYNVHTQQYLAHYKPKKSEARIFERWTNGGARKVCLSVKDEESLRILMGQAKSAGIITNLVKDAGHTEIPSGTITVLGIGPAPRRIIDLLVGELKPY